MYAFESEKCRKCRYRTLVSGYVDVKGKDYRTQTRIACNYCGVKGESRKCEAGDKCDKFIEGQPYRVVDSSDLFNGVWRGRK